MTLTNTPLLLTLVGISKTTQCSRQDAPLIPAHDCLQQCGSSYLLPETALDPNSTKPITRRAYEHSIASDQVLTACSDPEEPHQVLTSDAEADARRAFHASLGVHKTISEEVDHRPLKSSVSPAHPARFLADNPSIRYTKDGTTSIPVASRYSSIPILQNRCLCTWLCNVLLL
eukprot:jgi/Psemu1/43643/gm1.43643_g